MVQHADNIIIIVVTSSSSRRTFFFFSSPPSQSLPPSLRSPSPPSNLSRFSLRRAHNLLPRQTLCRHQLFQMTLPPPTVRPMMELSHPSAERRHSCDYDNWHICRMLRRLFARRRRVVGRRHSALCCCTYSADTHTKRCRYCSAESAGDYANGIDCENDGLGAQHDRININIATLSTSQPFRSPPPTNASFSTKRRRMRLNNVRWLLLMTLYTFAYLVRRSDATVAVGPSFDAGVQIDSATANVNRSSSSTSTTTATAVIKTENGDRLAVDVIRHLQHVRLLSPVDDVDGDNSRHSRPTTTQTKAIPLNSLTRTTKEGTTTTSITRTTTTTPMTLTTTTRTKTQSPTTTSTTTLPAVRSQPQTPSEPIPLAVAAHLRGESEPATSQQHLQLQQQQPPPSGSATGVGGTPLDEDYYFDADGEDNEYINLIANKSGE